MSDPDRLAKVVRDVAGERPAMLIGRWHLMPEQAKETCRLVAAAVIRAWIAETGVEEVLLAALPKLSEADDYAKNRILALLTRIEEAKE